MRCRPWAGALLLLMMVCACLQPAVADGEPTILGMEIGFEPEVGSYSVTDVDGSDARGVVMIGQGNGGVIGWDLDARMASRIHLPSQSRVVRVDAVGSRLLATDETGRLHGLDELFSRVLWSKTVLDGIVRTTAVSAGGLQMAFVGLGSQSEMVISVLDLSTMYLVPFWSDDLPEELSVELPKCAAWLEGAMVLGEASNGILLGTTSGGIHLWRGSGDHVAIIDLGTPIVGMAWHDYLGKLVAATSGGGIYIIDLDRGLYDVALPTSFMGKGSLVCFDMLGDQVAVGGFNGQVEIWNIVDKTRSQILRFHSLSCGDVEWLSATHLVTTNVYGRSMYWGPDTDGDEYADAVDHFPSDPAEWIDTDRDGTGDNRDRFPEDPEEWWDTDGDGYGDNLADAFPRDPTEWADTDGDGVGNNGDFLPGIHNTWALVGVVLGVAGASSLPVARIVLANRKRRFENRRRAVGYIKELGLAPVPDPGDAVGRARLDIVHEVLRVREDAYPAKLGETMDAMETTMLNLMVGLRVQEDIVSRGGVGADAAMSRTVQLRDQIHELDVESEKLSAMNGSFSALQDEVDQALREDWPGLTSIESRLDGYRARVQRLENTLDRFRRGSILRIGEHARKAARGAYVVATRDVGIKGSTKPTAVDVSGPPPKDLEAPKGEEPDRTPMAVMPPGGRLRCHQALLIREEEAELVVSVDNTLPEDLEELSVDLSIAGDLLRHKGPHRIELGRLVTGRSAAATFRMRVLPAPPSDEEPGELTRVQARVTGVSGGRKLVQELPGKTTNLISSSLLRPGVWRYDPTEGGATGRRGVKLPRIASSFVLQTLAYPHGLLQLLEGEMPGGGTWRIFGARTPEDGTVHVVLGVVPGAEWTELVVEVRGPMGFHVRELAEEVIDSLRFSILSDKRLRHRGEDTPLPPERIAQLAESIHATYIGQPGEVTPGGLNGDATS